MNPAVATVDAADLAARVARLTLEQKVRLLTGADFWCLHPEPEVRLRQLVVSDGPAGVRGQTWDERDWSANVPSATALAATWDEARIERLGRLLAAEARRKGVDVLLAPTVNLQRSPYGGRHFECFSEDPLLSGRIGAAYVRGLQSQGVGATVKHFVANDSETDRFTLDVQVDERALRELYLVPFEMIVRDGGVWAVMAAYNSVNGHTMTESPLLDQILRREWGFDGLVMTDWYAGRSLASAAGVDLIMPGPQGPWGAALVNAVQAGALDETVVDEKVTRLLRLAARVGALDDTEAAVTPEPWTPQQVAEELRATAAAGFVLARNEPTRGGTTSLLPLDATGIRRVAVIGANAAVARTQGGGSATVFAPYAVTPLDGIRAAFGPAVEVAFARGGRITRRVPIAPSGLLRRPDGRPGARLRFLAADGRQLRVEDRTGTAYAWLSSYGDGLTFPDVAVIEVETRLAAAQAGTYLVGASGFGLFHLSVAGAVAVEEHLGLPPGADPVEGIMRPPQLIHPITLTEGEQVDLLLRYQPAGVGDFGDTPVAKMAFQLNADLDSDDDAELDQAVAVAASADIAIVVVGTTEEVESEGFDRTSLALPGRQDELVTRIARANPRTVVAVNAGAPVLLPWADDVPAVLLCWFPGQEFGHALADVITGAAEPRGRLPVTWPDSPADLPSTTPRDRVLRYDEGHFIGYRWYQREERQPRFCFGHGLGYTTWDYLTAHVAPGPGTVVNVRLRNTGRRPGREVVQIYASKANSGIARPARWLAGWTDVEAQPGEEVTATVAVARRAFDHWDDTQHRWAAEPGPFRLHAGPSSWTLPLYVDIEPPSYD